MQTLGVTPKSLSEEYFAGCIPVSVELNLAFHQPDETVHICLGGTALDAVSVPQPEELPLTFSELSIFYALYYGVRRDFIIYEPSFRPLFQAINGTPLRELVFQADDQATAEHARLSPNPGFGSNTGYQWSGSGHVESTAPLLDMAIAAAQLLSLRSQTHYESANNRFVTTIHTQPQQVQKPKRSGDYFTAFASLTNW